MNLDVTLQPTELPLTLDEVKAHLRIVDNDEDSYLTSLISVAVDKFTSITLRSCMPAGYLAHFDGFHSPIKLERSPVTNVTLVEYKDQAGLWVPLLPAEYDVTLLQDEAYITPPVGVVWTFTTAPGQNVVRVFYDAGYVELPEQAKQWMKIIIGDMYENRNPDVPYQLNRLKYVDHLLDSLILPWEFKS